MNPLFSSGPRNDTALRFEAAKIAARICREIKKEAPDKIRVWTSSMPGGLPVVETKSGISISNLNKLKTLMEQPDGRILTS